MRSILYLLTVAIICSSCASTSPLPPSAPAVDQARTEAASAHVTGKVTGYTTAPQGEMDGFTLDSGTTVHFPPHTGAQLKPLLEKGQEVTVIGIPQAGPQGKVLEAATVKNLASGKSVNVASIPTPDVSTLEGQTPSRPPGAVTPPS